jgi:hypothetical protein
MLLKVVWPVSKLNVAVVGLDSVFADRKLIGRNWRGHYSIASSAQTSTDDEISSPSAFAVLMLITPFRTLAESCDPLSVATA